MLPLVLALAAILPCTARGSSGGEIVPKLPIGLAPAEYETRSGETRVASGPYREINGRLYVPAMRRRWLQALDRSPAKTAAGRHLPGPLTAAIPNGLVNDPAGQLPGFGNTQCEPVVAVYGDTVVCGFVDSQGFVPASGTTLSGYAWSFDGGLTWTDGGSLPLDGRGGSEMVFGDPTLGSDGHGHWYYVSPYDVGNGAGGPGTGDFGLVLHRGHFAGGTLVWSRPWKFAGGSSGAVLDRPNLVVDAPHDRLHVTYTNYSLPLQGWGQVEVVTLAAQDTVVLHANVVQPEVLDHNNAGSRLALGPSGELYCAWESDALRGLGQGPAQQKVARSLDQGASFLAPVVAATVVEAWFSGPPGWNREDFFPEFPDIAVDHTDGPNRGRVYLAWQDAVSMDFSGYAPDIYETTGSNDSPWTAQVLPSNLRMWHLQGSVSAGDPVDWYRFSGAAGTHVRMFLDYGPLSARVTLRCPGGPTGADTLLAASARGPWEPDFFLLTLPTTGEYYVAIERLDHAGSYSAWLRTTTNTFASVAHDHRDIVLVSSPAGVNGWTPKVRVNDDTGSTDQAMPALAVDACSGVHVAWYDRRFDPRCRARADFMLGSSYDGGATFWPNVRLSTESSSWQVPADGAPSFGDYVTMAAQGDRILVPWTDGRLGDPDVRVAPLGVGFQMSIPETLRAIPGRGMGLHIQLTNACPYTDNFFVTVTSQCPTLPDSLFLTAPLSTGDAATILYDAVPGSAIRFAVPCRLIVTSTGIFTHCTHRDTVLVINDSVPVEVSDWAAEVSSGAVRLSWRAWEGAVFDVERADDRAGPFARLQSRPLAAGRGGRFEFLDVDGFVGEGRFYRLVALEPGGERHLFGPYWVAAPTPRAVTLLGAEPNPFNPGTTLRFELPRAGVARLRILDMRGRVVTTLAPEFRLSAGLHVLEWDGRDAAGRAAPSGVYLAELRALGERRTARLVLLR